MRTLLWAAIAGLTAMPGTAVAEECFLTLSSSPNGLVFQTRLPPVFGDVLTGVMIPVPSSTTPALTGFRIRGHLLSGGGLYPFEAESRFLSNDAGCTAGELDIYGAFPARFRFQKTKDTANREHLLLFSGVPLSNVPVGNVWRAAAPCTAGPGPLNGVMVVDNGVTTQSFILSPVLGQDRRVMVTAEEPVNPAFVPPPPRFPIVSSLAIDAGCQTGSMMIPGTPWLNGALYGRESEPGKQHFLLVGEYSRHNGSNLAVGYLALVLSDPHRVE